MTIGAAPAQRKVPAWVQAGTFCKDIRNKPGLRPAEIGGIMILQSKYRALRGNALVSRTAGNGG